MLQVRSGQRAGVIPNDGRWSLVNSCTKKVWPVGSKVISPVISSMRVAQEDLNHNLLADGTSFKSGSSYWEGFLEFPVTWTNKLIYHSVRKHGKYAKLQNLKSVCYWNTLDIAKTWLWMIGGSTPDHVLLCGKPSTKARICPFTFPKSTTWASLTFYSLSFDIRNTVEILQRYRNEHLQPVLITATLEIKA